MLDNDAEPFRGRLGNLPLLLPIHLDETVHLLLQRLRRLILVRVKARCWHHPLPPMLGRVRDSN